MLLLFLAIASVLLLSASAFADDISLKNGWTALDANKTPISKKSQYSLPGPIKPIVWIKNGDTEIKVNDESVSYVGNTSVGNATAIINGDKIAGYKDAFEVHFKVVDRSKVTIKLSTSKMMIDNAHFNRVKLKAQLSGEGYSGKDIKWTITFNKPYTKAASFKSKEYLDETTGSNVTVWGKKWSGDTPIKVTAKLPNGKSATCKLKVISSSMDNDTHMKVTVWKGDRFYLTQPGTGKDEHKTGNKKPVSKPTKSWGNAYVAAYIRNAEWLINHVKSYQSDYNPRKLRVWEQRDLKITWKNGQMVVKGKMHYSGKKRSNFPTDLAEFCKSRYMNKERGRLSATDYLYLFTGKNQWEYLLKRNKKGKWSVVNSKRASAGWIRHGAKNGNSTVNGFSPQGYIRSLSVTYYGLMSQIQAVDNSSSWLYGTRTVLHFEKSGMMDVAHGTPSSSGCTHLGTYSDRIYYNVMKKAGLGTRAIFF